MDSLLNYGIAGLEEIAVNLGQPKYRGAQLFKWAHSGADYDKMSNLPKQFKDELSKSYTAEGVKILKKFESADGTIKYLFSLNDGNVIEGVLMRYKYGNTLCVSTQVGCRMKCAFCASGLEGLIRNLTAAEILGQVIAVNADEGGTPDKRAVTNVVLMGSGEPLDNYDNVTAFLRLVNAEGGINISERNISLSTSGLPDMIKRLANDGFSVTLTISLHAPNDKIRASLMPVNKAYNIASLLDAAAYYFKKTGRRYIFEYALIAGENDSPANAAELAALLKGLPCHVNLIRLNRVKENSLKASGKAKEFLKRLEEGGISATVRRTMGGDIEGACGQLRNKFVGENQGENTPK